MTKYIKKHHYISSDAIGILRESKDCTKHDWYKRFEAEGVDPEVYYFIFQNNDGLYIVHALLKELKVQQQKTQEKKEDNSYVYKV